MFMKKKQKGVINKQTVDIFTFDFLTFSSSAT